MARPTFIYWISYRDVDGRVHGAELRLEFELDTGDAVRKAEDMMRFSNGDTVEDAVNILTWNRLQ